MAESVAEQVQRYIASAPAFARPICRKLRSLIKRADQRLVEQIRWGKPTYVFEGLVCSVSAFKNHVALWFHKGSLLKDPRKLLQPGHRAQTMKQVRLTSVKEIDEAGITALVRQAVDLNAAGIKPKRKPIRVVVPKPLKEALAENPKAKAFFDSLAPSHRREYAEYVAEAKRPETVARRVSKTIDELTRQLRPHDKYRRKE